MEKKNYSLIERAICFLALGLMLSGPVDARVEEEPREAPREPPPHTTTVQPEPLDQHLNLGKCLHLSREHCPAPGDGCRTVGDGALFCCDIDEPYYRDVLGLNLTQHKTKYLHVLNGTIGELDLSKASYRRLASMAFTDGRIGQIVGLKPVYDRFEYLSQFPRYSAVACLNISHNNLTDKTLFHNRPFAYLFNLTVLDASNNNLTDIFLPVQSNKKISIDLSGNRWLPCRRFRDVMETRNESQVTFLNYNDTFCALDLSFNWFTDVNFVNIDYLRVQKELNARCQSIKPAEINCTCWPDLVEVSSGEVTRLVAVDCSHQNLTEMPSYLPPNTVQLNVTYNNISSLQQVADDPTYEHLRRLIIDHNDVSNILELEGTKFMENFMVFSIKHNKLKTIHTYVLASRFDTTGPGFMVEGNYLNCDCNTEKMLKPWILENAKNIPDYRQLLCQGMGALVDLIESQVCHTPRDWTDYIYYIIALEVLILVLLVSKVSYDYWVFKTAGYLPWPANKMPRLPCDWLCE